MAKPIKKNKSAPKQAASSEKAVYQILARQPLSMSSSLPDDFRVTIRELPCRIAMRPEAADLQAQLTFGGLLIFLEYEGGIEDDLLAAGRLGLRLIDDFLSAIALASGAPFNESALVQVARWLPRAETCAFLIFKPVPIKHWGNQIDSTMVDTAKHLLAHWDGLARGDRIRRAALHYRDALGTSDEVVAFQKAYMGLESLEPPLAEMVHLKPGTEQTTGKCEKCQHEFTKNRTMLVGLRSFILNKKMPNVAEPGRLADWKLMNALRQDVMHSLKATDELGSRPHNALLAAMHFLKAAIGILSHLPEFYEERYVIARGGQINVIYGRLKGTKPPSSVEWDPLVATTQYEWVAHERCRFVPELKLRKTKASDMKLTVLTLDEPMSVATMQSLRGALIERDMSSGT